MLYVFDDYTLDPTHYEFSHNGHLVRLEPRVFKLLAYLVQHPGHTVTTQELLALLYPGEFAPVERLNNTVAQVRKALGDTAQTQRYIQTVHRLGYRFLARVDVQPQPELDGHRPTRPETPRPAARPGGDQDEAGAPPAPVLPVPAPLPRPETPPSEAPGAAALGIPGDAWRPLTVLACQLMGVPGHAAPRDREALLEVLQAYHALCTEVLRRFDGYMAHAQGEWLLVYFGYPRAHEDDARRAVQTGLEMVAGMAALNRHAPQDSGERLAIQVGIHTGVELVGAVGRGAQPAALAVGETPSLAAQLQDLAAPDTVVISADTLRLVAGYFVCEPLESPGRDDPTPPLAGYRVLRASPARSRFDLALTTGLTPFVGREHEGGLLYERWQQAQAGRGQVVLLSGEAGIGKSRLVQELRQRLAGDGHTYIACHCAPSAQQSAFMPLIEHLQRLLHWRRDDTAQEKLRKLEALLAQYGFALDETVPLLAALLALPLPAHYPPLSGTPQRQKQQTLATLLAWLLTEAERQPVCVVFEDLHWVDPSTLEFLTLLITHVPTTRLCVVLLARPAFRPPWAGRAHLTPLTLTRLPPSQVETMVGHLLGGKALPAALLAQLVATTDGVPLFVEELTKTVVESGLVTARAGHYALAGPLPSLAIPTTLHDALMARLDQQEAAKPVAQLGATMGRTFAYELLQAVAPWDEATVQQGLAQLVEAELLYQRGLPPQAQYTFKHALIQEVAYQSLLQRTRRQYHQQIAQVLTEQLPTLAATQPELLAQHYTAAGLTEQAIGYWQRAGHHANARSAHVEARSHLTQGLALLATLPETPARAQQELDLQLALGVALFASRGFSGAREIEQTYARARVLCTQVGDTPQLFAALRGLCRFYYNRHELRTARELGEQLWQRAQRAAVPTHLLAAHSALGRTLYQLGDFAAALMHCTQGIALIDLAQQRRQRTSHAVADGVVCLSTAAQALWYLGFPAQAVRRSEEGLALAQALEHPLSLAVAQLFATGVHYRRRDGPAVQAHADALLALVTAQELPFLVGQGRILRGYARAMQGQGEAGLAQMRQGLATANEQERVLHLRLLAEVAGSIGQVAEGLRLLAEALRLVEAGERGDVLAETSLVQGALLLQQATPDASQAEAWLQRALDVAHRQEAKSLELRAATSLARLWQRQGKRADARQLLAPIYGWFTEGFDTADLQETQALLEELGG